MNEGRSGRSLPILVVALLLVLPIVLSLGSPDPNDEGPVRSSIEFDEDVIFERGTVFEDHHASYTLAPEVRDMVVGDLTGDGVSDVAVANRTSIFVYRGSGDGSLDDSPQTLTRPGMGDVRCLAVGDLDRDGRDDIAVTYTDAGGNNPKVTIFYQGSGFATARDIGTYPNPHQVVIGRFNNTVDNDLAVACGGDPKINVNANITLVRWPFTNPWDMVQISVPGHSDLQLLTVGLDGPDSRMDLVAADLGGDTVTVLTQPLSFSSSWSRRSVEIGGTVTSLRMVNLTGGGLRDLAVVNSAQERVEIRVNPGTGIPVLATAIYDQVEGISSMSFGRVTGTNLPDLALLSGGDGTCRLYPRHNGALDKNVYVRFPVNGGPLKVVALDMGPTANGMYVLANGTAGSLPTLEHYFLLEGSMGNADGNVFPDGGRLTVVSAGNLSFDALVSIVEGEDRVLVSDLSGNMVAHLPTRSGPCALHIDDLDGDLIDDLAVLNGGDGSISIYRGGAGLLTKNVPDVNITLVLSSPCSLTGGWIGALDEKVLVVGGGEGIEVIHDPLSNPLQETIGTATAGNRTDVAMGLLTSRSASGGIAALNADTGRVEVYFVRSDATVGDCYHTAPSAWLNMVGRYPTSIAIGDLDGDGREDVASGTSSGQVRLFMNSALGFYNNTPSSSSLTVPGQVDRLRAGDLNDDGLDDLAVCYLNLPRIGLFLSQWPSFSNNIQLTAGGPAEDVHVGDIDGDQRDDLVATSGVSGALSFWTQRNLAPHASAWFSTLAPYEGTGLGYSAMNTTDSSSDRASLTYLWNFGDGTTSGSVTGQHTYLRNGSYDGYVEVTDRAGATDRVEFHIDVLDVVPTASFTVSSAHPREGSQVWFNDTSLHYDEITYTWDFGDGSPTVAAQNTVHVFSSDGTYNVTLTVRENDGGMDQYVRTITVEDGTPISAILVGTTRVEEGKMASFFGDPWSYPDDITAYRWDFGDGTPAVTTRDAQHMFVANGSYVVTLTVWDDDGDMSSANITVTVHDQPPMASFTVPGTEVLEGETILFTDTSYAYDGIASWHWDLGDGRSLNTRNASVTYLDPGTYLVALTITESEGVTSTANRTIHVLASHPGASSLSVVGGGSSFLMDQQVRFQVTAWQTQLPITRYAWDLEYEPSLGFDEAPGASINQTSWYYRSPGEYMVCVRVYDANSYTERTLTITVSNVPPTATVVARHTGPDDLTFDGASSQDTASDRPYLEYRWNFGDGTGWTPWGLSSSVDHHYAVDGSFRASQEVRDRWGEVDAASCEVTVDTTAPTIDLDDTMVITEAYLGEELVIKVDVTDLSTISKVLLVYGWGEENRSLVMSRIAGTDTFVATIPQLTEVGPLHFHIEAEDAGGHGSLSATMNVSVVERPDDSWIPILGMAAIIASALLLLYFRRQNMVVDEVFMIYRDGNLMAHQTRRLKPGMDDQIMSSMLVAIQDFVRDSFKDEAATGLNRMDFGERKVLVEKGENIYLAVVLHGKREGRVVNVMKDTITRAESRYSKVLTDWDGDLEKVQGIKEEANRLLKSGVLDILSEGGRETTDD